MRAAAFMTLILLAGCGADGAPSAPEPERPRTGVSISGSATIGVSGGF